MAAYRAGDYEQALQALVWGQSQAIGDDGTMLAFRCMSLSKLGRHAEARESSATGRDLLAKR